MNVMTSQPTRSEPLPNIVHEAETQRQYIRIQIPISVSVAGKVYTAPNWSVGGVGIKDLDPAAQLNAVFDAQMVFPLRGFNFVVAVKCEVRHVTDGITGCRFLDLASAELSALQYLVSAYIAGRLVSSDDVLSIVERNNFSAPRKKPASAQSGLYQAVAGVRRIAIIALLLLIGFALILYLTFAIYQRLFVTTFDGSIGSPNAAFIRASADGIVQNVTVKSYEAVAKGATIGSILNGEGQTVAIISPCDCIVVGSPVVDGTSVRMNNTLATVAPEKSTAVVDFRARTRDAAGVQPGDRVSLQYYNGKSNTGGTVAAVQRSTPIGRSADDEEASVESYTSVQIVPDNPDSLTNYGEPVRVHYDRLQLFAAKPAAETPPPANPAAGSPPAAAQP